MRLARLVGCRRRRALGSSFQEVRLNVPTPTTRGRYLLAYVAAPFGCLLEHDGQKEHTTSFPLGSAPTVRTTVAAGPLNSKVKSTLALIALPHKTLLGLARQPTSLWLGSRPNPPARATAAVSSHRSRGTPSQSVAIPPGIGVGLGEGSRSGGAKDGDSCGGVDAGDAVGRGEHATSHDAVTRQTIGNRNGASVTFPR